MSVPSSVSISMSRECCCRPSMMCVAVTPCARHRVQHSTLQQPALVNAAAHVMKQKDSAMRRARGFASLGQDMGFLLPIPTLAWSSRDSNGWT